MGNSNEKGDASYYQLEREYVKEIRKNAKQDLVPYIIESIPQLIKTPDGIYTDILIAFKLPNISQPFYLFRYLNNTYQSDKILIEKSAIYNRPIKIRILRPTSKIISHYFVISITE